MGRESGAVATQIKYPEILYPLALVQVYFETISD